MLSAQITNIDTKKQFTFREMFLWIVICLLANHTIHRIDLTSFFQALVSLSSDNLVHWFAYYVIISRLLSSPSRLAISGGAFICALVAGLSIVIFSFVSYHIAIGLLGTVVSIWLISYHRKDPAFKSAGVVLLALSIHLVWAKLLFRVFLPYILQADAAAVDVVIDFLGLDIQRDGTRFSKGEHSVFLVGLCSSFHNVSLSLLIGAAAIFFLRDYWMPKDYVWILLLCILMISLNVLRVLMLAWSSESYEYWHNATGLSIFSTVQTVILGLAAFWGAHLRHPSK